MTRPPDDERVTRQFEQRSAWWDRIYQQTSLEARILRRRQRVALAWIDELLLPKGARVLEVGCGAGGTTVQLAKRGYLAYALDRSPAMLRLTQEHAVTSGVGQVVTPIMGDTHRLSFPTETFDLVIALGVLSWLQDPNTAIGEMMHVTPGQAGHVLVTSPNSLDVSRLFDPRRNPLSWPVKRARRLAASALSRPLPDHARPTRPRLVGSAAPTPQRAGPHPPDHGRLRTLSDSELLRSAGRLHLALTHKPDRA